MNNTFFIADTHFYDQNIIHYENRPFIDIDNMNARLIENWNNTVNPEDNIFILGDFAHPSTPISTLSTTLNLLNGHKKLVLGNHDILSPTDYLNMGFDIVYDYPIIFNDFFILSHYPLYLNSNMPYANIFGHVHNNIIYNTVTPQSYCVSAERINYTPISFTDITNAMQNK